MRLSAWGKLRKGTFRLRSLVRTQTPLELPLEEWTVVTIHKLKNAKAIYMDCTTGSSCPKPHKQTQTLKISLSYVVVYKCIHGIQLIRLPSSSDFRPICFGGTTFPFPKGLKPSTKTPPAVASFPPRA